MSSLVRNLRKLALAIAAGVAVAAVVGFAICGHLPVSTQNGGGSSLMSATCDSIAAGTGTQVQHVANGGNGNHTYFLIVAADPPSPFAGFNGSYYDGNLSEKWPVMNVHLGDSVSIHVINCQSHEPHGFAIAFYDDSSTVAVQPGHSYDVTFTATKTGTFRVYCSIFCAIHAFMQNGALVVN